jgi:hypothetical protein
MKKNIKTIFTSHWSYIFLCIIIIFIARLDIIELSNGFNFSFLKSRISVVIIEMIFMVVPLMFYFILTYLILRRIKTPRWSYAVIFLLPGILLGAYSLYYDLPQVKAYGTLKAAGLAPLPESAYDLKTYDIDLGLRANWNLWFKASPADIKSFLEQSPILKDAKYTKYSKEKVEWHDGMPSWYKLEIKKGEGRKYLYDHRGFGIQLFVDEKDNIVLVSVNWG